MPTDFTTLSGAHIAQAVFGASPYSLATFAGLFTFNLLLGLLFFRGCCKMVQSVLPFESVHSPPPAPGESRKGQDSSLTDSRSAAMPLHLKWRREITIIFHVFAGVSLVANAYSETQEAVIWQ